MALRPTESLHVPEPPPSGLMHPLSLPDRLLQLQVMPLSRLHLSHFQRVQTCLVLYLSAPLLSPQVSPLPPAPLPSFSTRQETERVDYISCQIMPEPPGNHHSLLVTLWVTLRSCHEWRGAIYKGLVYCWNPAMSFTWEVQDSKCFR